MDGPGGFGLLKLRLLFDRRSQRKWNGYLVAVCGDLLPNTPDFLLVPNQVTPGCFIEQCFGDRLVELPPYGHLSNYCLAAAASLPPAPILGQPLLDYLAREPKWSIQVVSGHLLVWRGAYNPEYRPSLPQSGAKVTELIQFATLVHKRLCQLGDGT